MKKNKRERSLPQPTSPAQCHASSLRSPIERATQRDPAGPAPPPLAHSRARRALSRCGPSRYPPRGPALLPPLGLPRPTSPLPLGLPACPAQLAPPPFPGRQAKSAQRLGRAPSPFSRVHAATRAHAAPHASVGAPSHHQEHCSSSPNRTK
jgi:hypothetical protein